MVEQSPSAFTRYVLFQVPGWALAALAVVLLREWADVSVWAAVGIFAIWVIKDFLLFPFLRPAYEVETRTGAERLIGEHGVAVERLDPGGYIRVRGELWRAETVPHRDPVPEGSRVTIHAARGFTLFVQWDRAGAAADSASGGG